MSKICKFSPHLLHLLRNQRLRLGQASDAAVRNAADYRHQRVKVVELVQVLEKKRQRKITTTKREEGTRIPYTYFKLGQIQIQWDA